MTEPVTVTASQPPVHAQLPPVSWTMRRIFCWTLGLALLGLLGGAIYYRQPGFAWPLVAALALDVMFYVGGATMTDVVQIVQSSGIIRAAQAAATAVTNVAATVSGVAAAVLPAPTTGGRTDLAS